MPDPAPRRGIATLSDLGVTIHRGYDWAARDIADELERCGRPRDEALARHPAVLDAADRLTARIAADLPPRLELLGDVLYAPADADPDLLARHAMRIKERAGYAEIVADTGLWRPPAVDDFPQVRVEGRADRITPAGHHVSHLAAVADVEYWAVYGIDPDGLSDWRADFANLTDARRHAARWQRPGTLVCTDHIAALPGIKTRAGQAVNASVCPQPAAHLTTVADDHRSSEAPAPGQGVPRLTAARR
jgi:hypothetical protein